MALDQASKGKFTKYDAMTFFTLYRLYMILYIYYFFFKCILDSKNRHNVIKR
jgi:hypothetical protein